MTFICSRLFKEKGGVMANTRIEKYKIYRESIINSGASNFETPKKSLPESKNLSLNTTSSLPLEQVMGTYQKQNETEVAFLKKRKQRQLLRYSLFGLLGAVVIFLLVFLLIKALN